MLSKLDVYPTVPETQLLKPVSAPGVDLVFSPDILDTSFLESPQRILVICGETEK